MIIVKEWNEAFGLPMRSAGPTSGPVLRGDRQKAEKGDWLRVRKGTVQGPLPRQEQWAPRTVPRRGRSPLSCGEASVGKRVYMEDLRVFATDACLHDSTG